MPTWRSGVPGTRAQRAERELATTNSKVHEALRAVGRELMRHDLKHCLAAVRASDAEASAIYDELVDMAYEHGR